MANKPYHLDTHADHSRTLSHRFWG